MIKPVCVAIFAALCLEALFSVGYRGTFLLTHSYTLAWATAVAALLTGLTSYLYRDKFITRPAIFFPKQAGSKVWFAGWLLLGLILRLGWVVLFPAPFKSDGYAYYIAAVQMAHHTYTGVYWPPGLPLLLTPAIMLFGKSQAVAIFVSLVLFAATSAAAWMLARDLADEQAADIAVALLAVWPGYLTTAGINSKENLIAFLLTTAMLLYGRGSLAHRTNWIYILFAGAFVGYAALTQPGCLLFVAVIPVAELLQRSSLWQGFMRSLVFGIAMVATIAPWTYRNLVQTHHFTLITVNGGSVFYRANNPRANASYSPEGEIHLPPDVYEADKVGYREGKRWIAEHPIEFLKLSIRKQVGYLGDDGIGVYETLERDNKPPILLYAGAKLLCSLFWFLIWLVLLSGAPRLFRMAWPNWYSLCFLPVIYQWLIDSIFESGSRHHLSDVAFLAVLVAIALSTRKDIANPVFHATN